MDFIKKLTDKSWLRSKTQWIAGIFGAIGAALAFGSETILPMLPDALALTIAGYILMINNAMAFVNRFFTKTGIWITKPPAGSSTGVRVEPAVKGATIPAPNDGTVEKVEDDTLIKNEERIVPIVARPSGPTDFAEANAKFAPMALTVDQYFQFYKAEDPQHIKNAEGLIKKVNALLLFLMTTHKVELTHKENTKSFLSGDKAGGYRKKDNPNGAPNSTHKYGLGVDITDPTGELDSLITKEVLAKFDLYKEHEQHTPYYFHLQDKAPGSGVRIYKI